MKLRGLLLALASNFLVLSDVMAQHLWWNPTGQLDGVCLYGEITVLATYPSIYYCGANWHPGEPGGGYCGIQHNGPQERRTIFSVWDTSPRLQPWVTQADPRAACNRFSGEGSGAHTHMLWPWQVGQTFQFFVHKQPGRKSNTTDTRYFICDRGRWLHNATITSPNGHAGSISSFGSLVSFLENFGGKDRAVPKLALYRLWLGKSADTMKAITQARGDGAWGQLHDAYFLAEGDPAALRAVFSQSENQYGKPMHGASRPISDKPVPASVRALIQNLSSDRAPASGTGPSSATTSNATPESRHRSKPMSVHRDGKSLTPEETASAKLNLAKQMLDDRAMEKGEESRKLLKNAKDRLANIIKAYPDTDAAGEARQILNTLMK
jgi:Domain of unknown function (DUF3472)